jgi:putative transcriptional regulator
MSIPASLSALAPRHKDIFGADCVLPPPGAELAAAIHEGEEAALPVWRVPVAGGYLTVPRLDVLPVERRGRFAMRPVGEVAFHREVKARGGRIALDSGVVALLGGRPLLPPRKLPPQVLHALSAATPRESTAVGGRALAESPTPLRRLTAAILRDLGGLADDEQLAQELGHKASAGEAGRAADRGRLSADRQARRDIADGRAVWREIPGAWPWWVLPEGLPRRWWREPAVIAAWATWRNGTLPKDSPCVADALHSEQPQKSAPAVRSTPRGRTRRISSMPVPKPRPKRRTAVVEARKRAGLTQAELARRISVDRTTVARVEAGTLSPSVELGVALARELDTTAEALFTGGER